MFRAHKKLTSAATYDAIKPRFIMRERNNDMKIPIPCNMWACGPISQRSRECKNAKC